MQLKNVGLFQEQILQCSSVHAWLNGRMQRNHGNGGGTEVILRLSSRIVEESTVITNL